MATLPNPLPRLADLGLALPPGKLIDMTVEGRWSEPLLWLADDQATPGTWSVLRRAARAVGLLPVLVDTGRGHGGPAEWELTPGEMSYPGDHDPEEVLADFWEACGTEEEGAWPGLAEPGPASAATDPDAVASGIADDLCAGGGPLKEPRPALVPARRSADIPTAVGWSGAVNHDQDTARLSSVLRSWEDRFGTRVVALGFDHLVLSVAAPPRTLPEAEAVAAEHFAFCPDTLWQGTDPTLEAYAARQLPDQPVWSFWWD
ncbi:MULTISPECIES: DUF4253 domain-containing protein [unclassified Streptomyces]|uniref:DUF4253 domain-containing protein n=1 Tax=unclassified Streptomyces TaxID=2593676 RepID=UPI0036E03B46